MDARDRTRHAHEFESRRRLGIGRFLTDSALAREGSRPLASALVTHLAGLHLRHGSTGKMTVDCDIYLDGFPLYDEIESVFTTDLVAVEYYRGGSAPPQYRRGNMTSAGLCVLLLWTGY